MKLVQLSILSLLSLSLLNGISSPALAKPKMTIEYLEKQITQLNGLKNERKKAYYLYELGGKYFRKGKLKKAESYIRQALEIEEKLPAQSSKKNKEDAQFIPAVHTRVALASVLIRQKRYDEAIKLYEEAVQSLEALGKSEEASKLLCHLGNIQIKLSRLDKATRSFEKAKALAKSSNATESLISSIVGLATIDRVKGDNLASVKKLLEAKDIGNLELDGIAYGRLINELARTYSDMDLYDKALENYSIAAKEFESYGELVLKARTLTEIGEVYLAKRESQKALSVLTEAFELLKVENTPYHFARALLPYGSALAENGQIDKALKYHRLAQKLAKRAGDKNTMVLALLEEGYDNFLKGDTEACLKCSLRANRYVAKYKGKVHDKLLAQINRDCGMGYRALGQTKAAIKYYEDAAGHFKKAGKLVDQAGMLESIAVAYLDEGDSGKFQVYHDLARQVFEGSESIESTSKLLRAKGAFNYNYGQFKVYQGKYADAIQLFEKSLKEYRQSNDQLGHCHALRGLGIAYLMLGQVGKSKDCYEEASVIASRIGNIESQWDCATGLGKAYIKLGDNSKAEEQLRKAVSLANKERTQFSRDSFKTLQLNLREDCFLELVELLVKEGKGKQALVVAESGRARAFLDMLEGRRVSSLSGKQLAMVTSDLLDDSPSKSTIEPTKIAMATGSQGSFNPGFRSVNIKPKTSALVSPSAISPVSAKAPDADELKSLVQESKSYVIEYITTPNSTIVWLLDPEGELIETKAIDCNLDSLKKIIRSTYTSIVTSPKGIEDLHKLNAERAKSLQKLYSVLIKPIEDKLPRDPEQVITVVPYGALYLVPFASLMDSQSKFLIEKHTINYLPSIAVLRATQKLSKSVNTKEDSLLAFGNPITEANKFLGTLPYSKEEVEKIASLFAEDKTKTEFGENATKSKFTSMAPDYSYLHLATHGLVNPNSPMDSSVVLAPEKGGDGLLSVKEILTLPRLSAKLIVLSACQTGKGKVTGDGVIGLSRAFIIAGTPSIMVSQWNVDDVMTQYQMTLLYKELLSGKDKAHSLRVAQLKTISFMEKGLSSSFSNDDETKLAPESRANPRYWSAFQLIGESQ